MIASVIRPSQVVAVAVVLGCARAMLGQQLENVAFRVSAARLGDGVAITVEDIAAKRKLADGSYYYHAVREARRSPRARSKMPP